MLQKTENLLSVVFWFLVFQSHVTKPIVMLKKKLIIFLSFLLFVVLFSTTVLVLEKPTTLKYCDLIGYNITTEGIAEYKIYKLYVILNVSDTPECESGIVYKFIAQGEDEDWVRAQYPKNPQTCFRSNPKDCDEVVFVTNDNKKGVAIGTMWVVAMIMIVCMFSPGCPRKRKRSQYTEIV